MKQDRQGAGTIAGEETREGQQVLHKRSHGELQETAWRLCRDIIRITTEAGSGHPSSSLSAIDVLTGLYFGGILRYKPEEPSWPLRDRFIMSKGHAAPALYAVLAEAGYFDHDSLTSLRKLGSGLEGHPNMRVLPGIEASTGSLGQGLSIGIGHALAARVNGRDYRVYVMIGDGESDEGQVWEAAMSAAKYRLDNLTAILDHNEYQQTGAVETVMPSLYPIMEKWEAFGWYVMEIDGHNMEQVMRALYAVPNVTQQPQLIIVHTRKGRGLSPFEEDNVNRKHGEALDEDETATALAELDHMKYWNGYGDITPRTTPEDIHGEI